MTDSIQINRRETLDLVIQRTILIYRWAVIISFTLIGAGFVIAVTGDQNIDSEMANPLQLLRDMADLSASGFIGLGIGVMVLSPIIMLVAATVSFFRANDRLYGVISLGVTVILSFSIVLSFVLG